MTPEFSAKLEAALSAYREFVVMRSVASCRLVHYCGVDTPNAIDVPLEEIENQIAGCLSEGLLVDWFYKDERLYICVQEPGCPIPPWSKVVAEEALADVGAILREAGFSGDA